MTSTPRDTPTHPAITDFAGELRELRRLAGAPSFNALARGTGHARSTLHEAVRGVRMPSLETTLAFARACHGDQEEWRRRWTEAIRRIDEGTPDPHPRTDSDGVRPAPQRQPWWQRHLRVLVAVAAVLVLATAGAAALVTGRCSELREYRVAQAGAVLDDAGNIVGQVAVGDLLRTDNLAHGRFAHRRYGQVQNNGLTGYVDEAKIDFSGTVCR